MRKEQKKLKAEEKTFEKLAGIIGIALGVGLLVLISILCCLKLWSSCHFG